jgi:hypothetical protein
VAAYNFVSHWHIAATVQATEEALLRSEDWVRWWPGLESVELLDNRIGVGARFACVWSSGVGYRLATVITITDYEPGRAVSFTSQGDLVGEGSFALARTDTTTTEIFICWNVDTTKYWMKLTSSLLRPLFVFSHHRLMNAGEQGLNRYVTGE